MKTDDAAFLARQAVFLQRQGLDAAGVEAKLAGAIAPERADGLRASLAPRAGSFRAALARTLADLDLGADELNLRGLAFEQAVREAYAGLWRSLNAFALYALGLAALATLIYAILTIFVVPSFLSLLAPGGGIPPLSRLVFESGLGALLLGLLWLFAGWTLLGNITARRAILLRAWSPLMARLGLLHPVLRRHRVLLHAWTAATLLELGLDPEQALARARATVAGWCGAWGDATDGNDDERLATARSLGTLREELGHRVSSELVEAPLALAARREHLLLVGGLVSALVVVHFLVAMYSLLFKSAAGV